MVVSELLKTKQKVNASEVPPQSTSAVAVRDLELSAWPGIERRSANAGVVALGELRRFTGRDGRLAVLARL